ncbi:LysM peptidoglycan-binding domain-containing protein [Bacillus songklensis]|uniref:LysM peptidoglycan-binding domain-containing protein n=1 Tax=Bacillus songklensis TaxID=1069116 RepID=A0ABV8B027_9BACI
MPVHVVQAGESLWGISRRYGTSIENIVRINGLESAGLIVPGLALYIPDQGLPVRYYQVRPGDTLWGLAQRFNTSLQSILTANPGMDPNRLYVGQRIRIPSPTKLRMETLGFIIPYSAESFLPILNEIAGNLTYLAIVAYSFTTEGNVVAELNDTTIISRSKQLNVIPLLTVRNFTAEGFSAELAGQVLGNATFRRNLVQSITNTVKQKGYGGVSIDFEFVPPPRRNDFNTFLRELKNALGQLILHVNVHAKTKDIPTNPIIGAYDYRMIGEIADIVAVMTIDYGYPTGPPNPISPADWMEQVIQYSVSLINPRKLQAAFPLYGYDWTTTDTSQYVTRALTVLAAQNLAISTGATIRYNTTFQSPWYLYWRGSEKHTVWFEDIRSYIAKYRLIDLYQLLGVTYWQLSFPSPQNWAYVERNFTVV